MTTFRVKIISSAYPNIKPKENESITIASSPAIFSEESICGYNILIVRQENVGSYDDVKQFSKEELDEFFGKPSVVVCLSDKEQLYEYGGWYVGPQKPEPVRNYHWLPEAKGLIISSKKGEGLEPTGDAGRLSNLLNAYEWEWKCTFVKLPSKYIPIARNISNQSVALRADIGEGRVFIIPTPEINPYDYDRYPAFLRQLIDVCEEEIQELSERERQEPDWVQQEVDPLESKLFGDFIPLYERYQTLRGARRLLYETSTSLTRIVHFIMTKMGFSAEMKEGGGTHDIEICEDDFNSVIEVTSSEEDWINIRKTRQLLDWCQRFEREQNKKPKGILIANHFCNHPPTERDEPFTIEASKQGEAEGFCLMTTVQLYKIFCKFLKGEMSKDEIKQLFLETQGLLQFED